MGWLINPFRFGGFSNLYSFLFDGVNEYLTVPDNASLDFEYNTPFSVSCWVNFNSITGYQSLIGKREGATGYKGYIIYKSDLHQIWFELYNNASTNTGCVVKTTSTLSVSTWYNIVCVYNGDSNTANMKIYINGVSDPLTSVYNALSTNTITNNNPFKIAEESGVYLNGYDDEVSIWNKALTGAEVTELYNSGVPFDLSTHSAVANLVSCWRMGDGATWGGVNWTVPDEIGSNDATSVNMELGDRTTTVP